MTMATRAIEVKPSTPSTFALRVNSSSTTDSSRPARFVMTGAFTAYVPLRLL